MITPKNNSNKSGASIEKKSQLRVEAEERNAAYQALPLEEKLARQSKGGKVYTKLLEASE